MYWVLATATPSAGVDQTRPFASEAPNDQSGQKPPFALQKLPDGYCPLRPGKSDDQKQRLTEAITRDVMATLDYGEGAVSVA